ncbi:MAG: hypothetical protein PHE33_04310 [Bacteroidales bacterium]|nr:hypothetical protein [Bacteroidales bacterium]
MKKQILIYTLFMALLTTFSGCAVVEGVFKTGMGVGIFLSILILGLIIFIFSQIFKRKK